MSRRLVRKLRSISSSPAEVKIKGATSNDPFGPTSSQLNEIAILSLDQKSLRSIINVLQKRINDSSQNWRHVLKSLTVIQYVILAGSMDFVTWAKENKYLISTLQEFQLKSQDEISQQIRSKAKIISKLLSNDTLLQEKRTNFHVYRNQMSQPSTDHRSSLDITREDYGLRTVTNNIPIQFQRGSKSFEISRRSFDLDNSMSSSSSSARPRFNRVDVETDLLADITEE